MRIPRFYNFGRQGLSIGYLGAQYLINKLKEQNPDKLNLPFNFKIPQSHTETTTKKKMGYSAAQMEKGIDTYNCRLKLYKKPKTFVTEQKSRLTEAYQNLVTGDPGNQTWFDLVYFGTSKQFCSSPTGGPVQQFRTHGATPYIDLNPAAELYGSKFLGVQDEYETSTSCLDSSHCEIMVKNMSTADSQLEMYIFKSTSWHNKAPKEAFEKALDISDGQQALISQPSAGVITGATVGRTNASSWSFKPGSVPEFKKCWHIVHRKLYHVSAAATKRINISINHNLVQSVSAVQQHNPGMATNRGTGWASGDFTNDFGPGAICVTFIQRGTPVMDDTAGGIQPLTMSKTQFGYIVRKTSTLSWQRETAQRKNINLGYVELPVGVADAAQRQINILDQVSSYTETQ